MKKILNFIVIFVLFTSNIFAADEIEKGKTLLKSLSKKSLTKKETISFLKEYAIILEDERGDGEVTYVFDDENYTRYKGTKIISSDAWRFSKLGALRLFNGDIKLTWKIKPKTKKTENLINIKAKYDPIGKLYEFSYQPKENFLELIQQAPEQQKAEEEKKKQEEPKLAEQQKADEEKVTEKKELKTYQISNEKELANYLVKNGLTLKKTHRWLFGEWAKLDLKDRKSIAFTFESDDKGNLFHLEDKAKMIIVWNALNKNSFNFKHPNSPYGPKVINLDLKNNLAQDVVAEGILSNKYEIITISAADIEKAKKEKLEEEKILEEYNRVLDKEYADKKGVKTLKKLIAKMKKCSFDVKKLELGVNKNSFVSEDINKWIDRAYIAIDYNNARTMRQVHGNLRRLAHEAFSSIATSYGTNNSTAKYCRSLDKNYKFNHSITFETWKKKNKK